MNLLISACLLGVRCRYDGAARRMERLEELMRRHVLVPVCPEVLGGLPTPRPPSELREGRVVTRDGQDVTEAFQAGAQTTLAVARAAGCHCALLKERSPSCGCAGVYDGTFSGRLCEGQGVCAALLRREGIRVLGESQVEALLEEKRVKRRGRRDHRGGLFGFRWVIARP